MDPPFARNGIERQHSHPAVIHSIRSAPNENTQTMGTHLTPERNPIPLATSLGPTFEDTPPPPKAPHIKEACWVELFPVGPAGISDSSFAMSSFSTRRLGYPG
ncbi:hypothetical protein SAMN02746041_00699 [Desulfacinum hydrothermale DSM 13146]|uniref:Uncharacterized protein n=1 Tax=Desulfacinum hydrothermale DSM 13146 TaxID=1121390 RepID=A0A1W1X6P9_9BACT|nr:hypothetical protein SAMN02746041_00699 [Desulfacinum hydrothermale DSM 13146]